ncbi:TIR domain-containing protein [Arthrobacter sp. NPDC056493]|uniref:TIR domain-containing protein n=1 Tax=Arthrobacter sp. NPDC056493 TaxID=3345839 RepID=UPI00366A82A2
MNGSEQDADIWSTGDFSWLLLTDLSDDQIELLDAIWHLAIIEHPANAVGMHWPTWRDVDQYFFDLRDHEAGEVHQQLPSYSRIGIGPHGSPYGLVWRSEGAFVGPIPRDDEQVGLTIAGLVQLARHKKRNTQPLADDLVRIIRTLAQASNRIRRESRGESQPGRERELADYAEWLVSPRSDKPFVMPVEAIAQVLQKENVGVVKVGNRWVAQLGGTGLRKYLKIETAGDYLAQVGTTLSMPTGPYPHLEEEKEVQGVEQTGKTVFIVHGHDEAVRDRVDAFVQKTVANKVIILHDEDDNGDTIIEKFEQHASDAACAIVLLTPDDVGRAKTEDELRPRARQNVVFELGYFAGLLGRRHVMALVKDHVEQPSDLSGVLYIPLDSGEWKRKLERRLKNVDGISLRD